MNDQDETAEPPTDEFALLRRSRFGTLPKRIVPDEITETARADLQHEEPPPPQVRLEWG